MNLLNGHESFLALSNRGALSILDASFKLARASYLVSREPWPTVRLEQRAFGGIFCLLRSDWSRVCGEGCREPASEDGACLGADTVPEQFQVHRCQVPCASFHRARCRFRMFKFGRE